MKTNFLQFRIPYHLAELVFFCLLLCWCVVAGVGKRQKTMIQVFLFAGQSNMSAYSPLINLGAAVPGYAQTAANEWTGAGPRSIDSNIQYPYPTLANSPCLFNSNTRGDLAGVFDTWGAYIENSPQYNSGGALGDNNSYGLELSFLKSHLTAYPGVPIACVKQSLGGTGLRSDWLPADVAFGTARGGHPRVQRGRSVPHPRIR